MAFYKGQRLVSDAESLKSREWVLEGLPARNRLLMKHVVPVVCPTPKWAYHGWRGRLYTRACRLVYKLFKQDPGPNEEATHEHWGFTLPMLMPRTVIKRLLLESRPPIDNPLVAEALTVLDAVNGRSIRLDEGRKISSIEFR